MEKNLEKLVNTELENLEKEIGKLEEWEVEDAVVELYLEILGKIEEELGLEDLDLEGAELLNYLEEYKEKLSLEIKVKGYGLVKFLENIFNEQLYSNLQNELLELKNEVAEEILKRTFGKEDAFFSDECIETVADAITLAVADMEINQCIELCERRGYTYLADQLTNLAKQIQLQF